MRDVLRVKLAVRSLFWFLATALVVVGGNIMWRQINLANTLRQAEDALRRNNLGSARQWYQQALSADQQSVRALRGLARADPGAAIDYLEHASRLRPSSQLVQSELARAYEDAGQFAGADALWSNLNIDNTRALQLATSHFSAMNYADAARWFELFLRHEPSAGQALRFQAVVAAIASGRDVPPQAEDVVEAYPLDVIVHIMGGDLRWVRSDPAWQLDYGTPLANYPQPPDLLGVLWWDGPAVAVVHVPNAGKYRLSARVRNGARESTAGAAAEIWLEHNLQPVTTFTLAANDQWYDYEGVVDLTSGLHLIGLRCLQIEPDPVVDWIQLEAS